MIKITLSLFLLASCSSPMKKDCPIRKKGIKCHQKAIKSILKKGASKQNALKDFKNCCEKYGYANSCKEVESYN